MHKKIIAVKITKVLSEVAPQTYVLNGVSDVKIGFASFALLDFGEFLNERKNFNSVLANGKCLVVIHRCPPLKNYEKAFSAREPRKKVLKSCSMCSYRFDPIALPDSVENDESPENTENLGDENTMEKPNLPKILAEYEHKGVTGISEVVGVWNVDIDELPINLKVKVVRYSHGKYEGKANYCIQGYLSMRYCDTVEDALRDALQGFLSNWNPQNKDKLEFRQVRDW